MWEGVVWGGGSARRPLDGAWGGVGGMVEGHAKEHPFPVAKGLAYRVPKHDTQATVALLSKL